MSEITPIQRKESIESLIEMVNEFEIRLDEITSEGHSIVRGCRNQGGWVAREGEQMESYLINRLRNFINGYEQFKFDSMREALKEELEEIKSGVYGDLEEAE